MPELITPPPSNATISRVHVQRRLTRHSMTQQSRDEFLGDERAEDLSASFIQARHMRLDASRANRVDASPALSHLSNIDSLTSPAQAPEVTFDADRWLGVAARSPGEAPSDQEQQVASAVQQELFDEGLRKLRNELFHLNSTSWQFSRDK